MTDASLKLELNSFLSKESPDERRLPGNMPLKFAGAFLFALAVLGYFICDYAVESRKETMVGELHKQLDVSATGKARVIETWLAGTIRNADRIVSNDLFQLFATEINLVGDGKLERSLNAQLPYMQNALTKFTDQNELVGAYLISTAGRAYLASANAPALSDVQRAMAQEQYGKTDVTFLPFRETGNGLVFDYLLPIRAAQTDPTSANNVVGVLLITVPASKPLSGLLDTEPFSLQVGSTRLYQEKEGQFFQINPLKPPFSASQPNLGFISGATGFQELQDSNGRDIFASGAAVSGTNLAVFQIINKAYALASLQNYALFVYGLAICIFIVVMTVLVTVWLMVKGQSARALAQQYKEFAAQINVQRRLLGSINNTIDELISLTDPEGRYIYANPSLARLADFPLRSIPGKTDRDIFGDKAAHELAEYDRKAIATEQTVNAFVDIETREGVRTLRVAKSRFLNEDGAFIGIVTVCSDITEFVEYQRRKEEMDRKSISVLSQMLEANDPYLSYHSARMAQLTDYISTELGLPPETRKLIHTSAHLSQIGKISIPREIREKTSRLSEDEQKIMQGHILTAEKILTNADVEKPVLETVTQINERLDGSGYPNGLTADEIKTPARLLGMADILIARISSRSYRESTTVDEALRVFRENPEKYDSEIVEAMVRFFDTEIGRDFKASIEKNEGKA
ncbi:HD domain-containing phosphohydrolase [uncultured Sneathiella sp.]|uniref:HD domain-containing phosphohydrolase n=1 Tax=uncultured Sneathiella sp. TaxID=879315 RepID=UPI0030EDC8A4|tara:strand:- start:27267 stop:29330 length:2064 start_codon:yes stop_codon:yes gene_type:complete